MSDLIQVLLRPVPERRPSAEQLLTCSKLDQEVKAYLRDQMRRLLAHTVA